MVGWTNTSGGGLNIQSNKAVIHVTAPVGSTITLLKDNIICSVLGPDKCFQDENSRFANWYFSVSSSNYGTFTIQAQRGTSINSTEVIVNNLYVYDVSISYYLYLYNRGDTCTDITGGWNSFTWRYNASSASAKAPTVTYNSDNVYLSLYAGAGAWGTQNTIDLTKYQTIHCNYTDSVTDHPFRIAGYKTKATYYQDTSVDFELYLSQTSNTNASANISSVTGLDYIALWESWASGTATARIYSIYLEEI